MADVQVQRGTDDVGNTGGTNTSFTAVSALTAAFEYNSNSMFTHGGSISSGGNMEGDDMSGMVELTGTGTLTFTRQSGSLSQNMRHDWQLLEYTGSPGGANEFIVRSRNTITMSGASGSASLDTTPTDTSKCVPFITGVRTSQTGNNGDELRVIAYIDDSGTLQVEKGSTTNTTVVQVVTVEFTGSNWSVYHGTATSSADTGSITLNTDSDGAGGSTGDVSDWSTAFIDGSFTSTDQGLDSVAARYNAGAETTTVDWDFQSGNNSSHKHFVHVVKHADMSVTRYTPTGSAANNTNVDITSAGLTELDAAFIIGTCQGSGGGTAYGRNWRNYRITSLTNAQHYCHRSGNTINHNIQIVDFAGVTSAGGGQDDLLADDVETSSEVSAPTLTPVAGTDDLLADDVEASSEVALPSLGQTHGLAVDDTSALSQVGSPSVGQGHNLAANDVESASEAATASLGQEHSLGASSPESGSEVTDPALTPVFGSDSLSAEDVESACEVSSPNVGQIHGLSSTDTAATAELTAPAVGQVHVLGASSSSAQSEVSNPALTEVAAGILSVRDVESASEVAQPALGQVHELVADNVVSLSSVSRPGSPTEPAPGGGGWGSTTSRYQQALDEDQVLIGMLRKSIEG